MKVTLQSATDPSWLPLALEQFDVVLVDHAHCEKKAATNALSLLQSYPEVPGLPAMMARLAREESTHLARVLAVMEARGLLLSYDRGDPYAMALQKLMRNPAKERRLDRMLVAAIIEARSHERLQLLADGLKDPELKKMYAELAQSEDGHQELFVRLAERVDENGEGPARLAQLLTLEAQVVAELPVRAAIH